MAVSEGLIVNGISYISGKIKEQLVNKYHLAYRMRRALKGKNSLVGNEQILEALQIAIGNSSTLTSAANATLVDLANSKLLENLMAVFGSSLNPENAFALIEYIHRSRGCTDRRASIEFAKSLGTCLQTLNENAEAQLPDEIPDELRSNIKRRRDDEARRAESIFDSIIQKLKNKDGEWIEHAEITAEYIANKIEDDRNPLKNFVTALKNTMNTVDVHGASGDVVKARLDDIYVDVPVSIINRKGNFNRYEDLRRNISRHPISASWDVTLSKIESTVLLGDPGGGKSTLSKKLCMESCNSYLAGHTKLPIYIQLRTYIAKAADDDRLSLKHYIFDFVSSTIVNADEIDLTSTILYHLRIGAVFFVADGLDEVLTTANRARVVQELLSFKREFPLCQLLVTSRYVGYETQPLDGFTHFGVDHLNDDAIRQIYRNVSSVVLNRPDQEVSTRLSGFLDDAKTKAKELIRSPLLLTLIVIIYDKKSEIPDNRANLYSFCADLLFDQWDKYRDITPDLPERYRLFDLFKHLAALLYENEEYGGTISKVDLEREARDFFKTDYIDNREGRSAAAARHMVDHLTGRAWVLHEVGENIFEFTHRTFMEFFYAKFLDTEFESTTELVANCLEYIMGGQRTLPTHLALQIRTSNKRAASTKVAETLTLAMKENPRRIGLIDFSLDSLGYILPNGDALQRFVLSLAKPAIFSIDPFDPYRLLCTPNPLRNNILNICSEQLDRVRTVEQLTVLEPALRNMHREQTSIMISQDGTKVDIVNRVLERFYPKQATSPYLCKMAFDLDSSVNWNAAGKFGFRLWGNSQSHPEHIVRLYGDSREMLKDASKFIIDADAHTGKYLKLAQAIYKTFFNTKSSIIINPSLIRHYDYDAADEIVDYSTDLSAWREDVGALEVFAFSLLFYAHVHGYSNNGSNQEKLSSTVLDLREALEGLDSDYAQHCDAWLQKGKYYLAPNIYVSE